MWRDQFSESTSFVVRIDLEWQFKRERFWHTTVHIHTDLISYKERSVEWFVLFCFCMKITLLYFLSTTWGYCRVDEALAVTLISTQQNDPVVHGESLIWCCSLCRLRCWLVLPSRGNQSTHSFPLVVRKLISYSCSCILLLIGLVLNYQLLEWNVVGKVISRRQFVSGQFSVYFHVIESHKGISHVENCIFREINDPLIKQWTFFLNKMTDKNDATNFVVTHLPNTKSG